jgi:hypothetical protein
VRGGEVAGRRGGWLRGGGCGGVEKTCGGGGVGVSLFFLYSFTFFFVRCAIGLCNLPRVELPGGGGGVGGWGREVGRGWVGWGG